MVWHDILADIYIFTIHFYCTGSPNYNDFQTKKKTRNPLPSPEICWFFSPFTFKLSYFCQCLLKLLWRPYFRWQWCRQMHVHTIEKVTGKNLALSSTFCLLVCFQRLNCISKLRATIMQCKAVKLLYSTYENSSYNGKSSTLHLARTIGQISGYASVQ